MHANARRLFSITAATAVAGALVLTAPSALAAPSPRAATSTDKAAIGLFGEQDPTYDGVYRQSLSLIALDAAGARIPKASVKWLLRQQCGNGRFPSYTDLTGKCGVGEVDSTAMATIALKRIGERRAARAALTWLVRQQTDAGGWEFNAGFGPNANSTGLAVQAMIAMKVDPTASETDRNGLQFLRSLQLRCKADAASRGALDYQPQEPLTANDFATAQATQAMAGSSLPVRPAATRAMRPALTCPKDGSQPSPSAVAAGYLGRTISAHDGAIPGVFGPGPDLGSTANAVMSLVAAGYGTGAIAKAVSTLETNAASFTRDPSDAVLPASAAALALTAHATGGNPRSFGGTNPVRDILDSRTLAG
jgi:hypothetical protein